MTTRGRGAMSSWPTGRRRRRWSASSWTRGSARFGASYDPSDAEANIAGQVKHGGAIVHGGMLTGEQWENVKAKGAIEPAGRLWPTPKPYSDDPDAPTAQLMDRKDWTPGMARFRDYLCWVAAEVLGVSSLTVRYPLMMNATACYVRKSAQRGTIDFNVGELGIRWFDSVGVRQDELMIHELAHHRAGNHYSEEFHEACCEVGRRAQAACREAAGEDGDVHDGSRDRRRRRSFDRRGGPGMSKVRPLRYDVPTDDYPGNGGSRMTISKYTHANRMTPEQVATCFLSYVGTKFLYDTTGECPLGADIRWAKDRIAESREAGQYAACLQAIAKMQAAGILQTPDRSRLNIECPGERLKDLLAVWICLAMPRDLGQEHADHVTNILKDWLRGIPSIQVRQVYP